MSSSSNIPDTYNAQNMPIITSDDAKRIIDSIPGEVLFNEGDDDLALSVSVSVSEPINKKKRGRPPKHTKMQLRSQKKSRMEDTGISKQGTDVVESSDGESENEVQQIAPKDSEALQKSNQSRLLAIETKKNLESAVEKGKNEMSPAEKASVEKATKTLNDLKAYIKSKNYYASSSEINAMIDYGVDKNVESYDSLLVFLDGYRVGIEKGNMKKEAELLKFNDYMSKSLKELQSYSTSQANMNQELKGIINQFKSVSIGGKDTKSLSEIPASVSATPNLPKASASVGAYSKFVSTGTPTAPVQTPKQIGVISGSLPLLKSRVTRPLENPENEKKLQEYMKILKIGENHLSSLGDRAAIGNVVLICCQAISAETYDNIKQGKAKASDVRKQVIEAVQSQLLKSKSKNK